MMRRNSPPRSIRRSSPIRGRSRSPTKRPNPFSSERRPENPWNSRYRSQSREWEKQPQPEPPIIDLVDDDPIDYPQSGDHMGYPPGDSLRYDARDPSNYPSRDMQGYQRMEMFPAGDEKKPIFTREPMNYGAHKDYHREDIREPTYQREERRYNADAIAEVAPNGYNYPDKLSTEDRLKRLEDFMHQSMRQQSAYPEPPKQDDVPEFIPHNPKWRTSMWLNEIQKQCMLRNYDDKSCVRFLEDHMPGIIEEWYKTMLKEVSFTELSQMILKLFPDNMDFVTTLRLLLARTKLPDETMLQYYFSKLYLCEASKIFGENAVLCIIDGLNNQFFREELIACNFLTPQALHAEFTRRYEERKEKRRDGHMRRKILKPAHKGDLKR